MALDESTDVTDIAQCAIFVRGVTEDLEVIEEFLDLVPMHGSKDSERMYCIYELSLKAVEGGATCKVIALTCPTLSHTSPP